MAAANTTTKLTMKLLINTRERRVLYAKTTRDVVAFLYSLLESPDTSITLDAMTWHGCTDSIVDSLEELDDLATRGGPPPPPQQQRQQARSFFVCAGRRRGEYVAIELRPHQCLPPRGREGPGAPTRADLALVGPWKAWECARVYAHAHAHALVAY